MLSRALLNAFGVAVLGLLVACAPGRGLPDRDQRDGLGAAAEQAAAPASRARAGAGAGAGAGRHAVSYLYLSEQGPEPGLPAAARDMLFAARAADRVSIRLVALAPGRIGLSATCDGRARFLRDGPDALPAAAVAWTAPGQPLRADLPPGERARSRLELDPATGACTLQVTPAGRPGHELRLRREDLARPALNRVETAPGACRRPRIGADDALAAVFHADRGLAQTCPQPLGRVSFLDDGIDALNARVAALTGRPVSRAALAAGDPGMRLDFAQAPDLDLIVVSYLNINADFSGYLTLRMLAHHAARGTVVRILVPDVMLTRVERALFEGFAARFPTIQLHPHRVPPDVGTGAENHLGRFHRTSHVKLFATLAREPGRSVAIIGGRNLHDGYVFAEPLDLTAWPFLQQYRPGAFRIAGGFSSYVDFELALHDDRAVRAVLGHFNLYWHRDADSQRPWAGLPPPRRAAPALVPGARRPFRHFLSVPYADGAAQEGLFVDLIDAARHRIDIASPYMNLSPALDAAFRRARARGVAVNVVTTVRVREATDVFVTSLNRAFANAHSDWVRFTDYDPEPRMLHSKIVVIDRRLAVVASTNLNRRSFLHDTENGVMILDPALAERIARVVDGYVAEGRRTGPDQRINPLVRVLLRWPLLRRAF